MRRSVPTTAGHGAIAPDSRRPPLHRECFLSGPCLSDSGSSIGRSTHLVIKDLHVTHLSHTAGWQHSQRLNPGWGAKALSPERARRGPCIWVEGTARWDLTPGKPLQALGRVVTWSGSCRRKLLQVPLDGTLWGAGDAQRQLPGGCGGRSPR